MLREGHENVPVLKGLGPGLCQQQQIVQKQQNSHAQCRTMIQCQLVKSPWGRGEPKRQNPELIGLSYSDIERKELPMVMENGDG